MRVTPGWKHPSRFALPMQRRLFRLAVYGLQAGKRVQPDDARFLQKTLATQPEVGLRLPNTRPLRWTRNPSLSLPRMGLRDGQAELRGGQPSGDRGGCPRW